MLAHILIGEHRISLLDSINGEVPNPPECNLAQNKKMDFIHKTMMTCMTQRSVAKLLSSVVNRFTAELISSKDNDYPLTVLVSLKDI